MWAARIPVPAAESPAGARRDTRHLQQGSCLQRHSRTRRTASLWWRTAGSREGGLEEAEWGSQWPLSWQKCGCAVSPAPEPGVSLPKLRPMACCCCQEARLLGWNTVGRLLGSVPVCPPNKALPLEPDDRFIRVQHPRERHDPSSPGGYKPSSTSDHTSFTRRTDHKSASPERGT